MDAYPPEYVAHNLPFLVLSGLGTSQDGKSKDQFDFPGKGVLVNSQLPVVTGPRADQLWEDFLSVDGSRAPWTGRAGRVRDGLFNFNVRAVGRKFTLPARKAEPPKLPPNDPLSSAQEPGQPQSWILHSPISPLSPGSPVYPDGLMTPTWVAKHQSFVPAVFISFFSITSDPNLNSLNDNQLKSEINSIKAALQQSEYKTRFAVVLLSEKTIIQAPDIEDRLGAIKRATGLDPKNSLFFLPPNTSRVEIAAFTQSILSALQPMCIEYYRDLAKHARRKKNRGIIAPPTIPPTKGTSQTLSNHGWAVRYEYKQGVFAEFRQDMETAGRHYAIALESLLGADGAFESTASWSPRWDEIRLFSDTIALRSLRCLLWNDQSTSAIQTWFGYRVRMRDIIDRRGKGSMSYGWAAWEFRWAKIMAELIQRANLPIFSTPDSSQETDILSQNEIPLFMPPEKTAMFIDRLGPWQFLHHVGYWLRLSAAHAIARRALAEALPEEDRTKPGETPATQVVHRSNTYDTYLVPDPYIEHPLDGAEGYDHCTEIIETLGLAIKEFHVRKQYRLADSLRLRAGQELINAGRNSQAHEFLKPLWEKMSWRTEGWWTLVSEVTWAVHESALRVKDAEVILATEWELLCDLLPNRKGYKPDFMNCLNFLRDGESDDTIPKTSVSVDNTKVTTCVTLSFTFSAPEEHVGESLRSQIVLKSRARPGSAPIILSNIKVTFNGFLDEIQINHQSGSDTDSDNTSRLFELNLNEEIPQSKEQQLPRWVGYSDLTLHPQQTKVLSFSVIFRDAGDVAMVNSTVTVETESFVFSCTSTPPQSSVPLWWLSGPKGIKHKRLNRELGTTIKVLPKPPKMEIHLPDLLPQYYTDEKVTLDIDIINKEEESAEATVEVRILGHAEDILAYSWTKSNENIKNNEEDSQEPDENSPGIELPGHTIGHLERGAKHTEQIKFVAPQQPAEYILEVKVLYHLLTDRDTPISKTITAHLIIADPFETTYDVSPRVHPDPWPSFFRIGEHLSGDGVLMQTWVIKARLASFASEPLVVRDMELILDAVHGGEEPIISREFSTDEPLDLIQSEVQERAFCIITRKANLEERRSQSLDLNFKIKWHRKNGDANPVITTLVVPSMMLPGSEPRVLAAATSSTEVPSLIHLDYTLENPTMHFLTFEVSMDASDEFAFSGPKLGTLNLLPLSRHSVHFNIYPLAKGTWITPQLRVVDRYFNKTLKVLATDGIKMDKNGIMVWVDADEEESS